MSDDPRESAYRWVILALGALTDTIAIAIPSMALPVLFEEIRTDLSLSVAQIGLLWGIGSLPGIITMLIGGAIADRFGPRRALVAGCLLAGFACGLRGLSSSYAMLIATVLLNAFMTPIVSISVIKMVSTWFPRRQLGLANGVISMGMALGFMLGTLISASVLSPALGGWRYVLLFYGSLTLLLSIPWALVRRTPRVFDPATGAPEQASMRQALGQMARIRQLWLLGWALFGIGGAIQGLLGYLPLYLRSADWPPATADAAASTFHLVSMICVVPIALLSDRRGTRRNILIGAGVMIATGVGLLSVAQGLLVWVAIGMAGMVRDGFMAVFITMIMETRGVGPVFVGTATGLVSILSGLGSLIAPSIGNSLAVIAPNLPFVFWSLLAVGGILGLLATREASRAPAAAVPTPVSQAG